jgi:hypothetical protein
VFHSNVFSFKEPKGGDKNVFEGILNKFYNQIDRIESEGKDGTCDGALFFAVSALVNHVKSRTLMFLLLGIPR